MIRKPLLGIIGCSIAILGISSTAYAGEVTGNGKTTPIDSKANSACAFSGLEDNNPGSGDVVPGDVQNWGHSKDAPVVVAAPRGASDVTLNFGGGNFQEGCNAHLFPNPEK